MAYTIVERSKEPNKIDILKQPYEAISTSHKDKGKIHGLFERSFDCNPGISLCTSYLI